jgi:stage II sporulation protein D
VYKGLEKSTSLTEAAIESTKGEVMTYKGDFIQAYYHSTCSGHTEGMDAWGQPEKPYLKPKPDYNRMEKRGVKNRVIIIGKGLFQRKN